MAIQRSDLPQLNENTRNLQRLLIGGQNQRDLAAQQGQQASAQLAQQGAQQSDLAAQQGLQQQELQSQVGQQNIEHEQARGEQQRQLEQQKATGQKEFFQPYLSGEKQLPAGITSASIEGASLHGVDPASLALKQMMLQNREDTVVGREGKNVQNQFDTMAKEHINALNNLKNSEAMIKQNNLYSMGPEQIQFVRGIIGSGRLAQQEIPVGAPRSFWQDLNKKYATWTSGDPTTVPQMTPEEQSGLLNVIGGMKAEHLGQLNNVYERTKGSVGALAPHSTRAGRSDEILSPLQQYISSVAAPTPGNQFTPPPSHAVTNPQQSPTDKLRAFLSGMMGGGQQQPQAVASPNAMSPDQKAARIQELLNKKNGQ